MMTTDKVGRCSKVAKEIECWADRMETEQQQIKILPNVMVPNWNLQDKLKEEGG